MHITAPAKLNLNLRIIGKRADGFHLLQSLAVFTTLTDAISIAPAADLSLTITGNFGAELSPQHNLILQAARLLDATKGAAITLHKNIPIGAGLGGGSADAACTLKALNQFWNLNLPLHRLIDIAKQIGSDVPACILSNTQWMEHTGDLLTPITSVPSWHLVLVYPNKLLTAKEVYSAYTPPYSAPQPTPKYSSANEWRTYLQQETNDLTHAASSLCPDIQQVLTTMQSLPNLCFARMSGSGSTCFAAFKNAPHAAHAAAILKQHFPTFWVHTTQTI